MKELLKVLEFTADRTQALADSQSVAGEPLHVGDVTLIPVSSISCGFAGGGSDLPARTRNDAAAAGSGARLAKTPVAFLAVCGQEVQVLTLEQPAKEEKATAPAAESTGRKIAAGAACPAGRKGPAGRRGKEGGQGRRNASGKGREEEKIKQQRRNANSRPDRIFCCQRKVAGAFPRLPRPLTGPRNDKFDSLRIILWAADAAHVFLFFRG